VINKDLTFLLFHGIHLYTMMEKLHERVSVRAFFDGRGKIIPLSIYWMGRNLKLLKPDAIWREKIGNSLRSYFSVSDGVNRFILSFNHETLEWRIEEVYSAG